MIRLAIALCVCTAVFAQDDEPEKPALEWMTDFDKAAALAAEKGMPLMVFFITEASLGCKQLEAGELADEKVVELAKQFIRVKVDANKNPDFIKRFELTAVPTICLLDAKEETLGRFQGFQLDAKGIWKLMKAALKKNNPEAGIKIRWAKSLEDALVDASFDKRPVVLALVRDDDKSKLFLESLTDRSLASVARKCVFAKLECEKKAEALPVPSALVLVKGKVALTFSGTIKAEEFKAALEKILQ